MLVDLDMPAMHGQELIQHLRRGPAALTVPVLAYSNSARVTDIRECHRLGADHLSPSRSASRYVNLIGQLDCARQGPSLLTPFPGTFSLEPTQGCAYRPRRRRGRRLMPHTITGDLKGEGHRIALAVARFNGQVVEHLVGGAIDGSGPPRRRRGRHHHRPLPRLVGAAPGLPQAATSGKYDAVIASAR